MMAAGELASPQRYHNVVLYNMRVTGTGVSFRPQLNEYVYRKPENYLTQEFLDRCAGLPVIVKHPEKSLLDHDEFVDRVAGTVFVPYIKGDEVWAICKLYDKDAIAEMEDEQLSTSPAVLLGKSDKLQLEDGSKLLVEGKPTLLDHLAIVAKGVWDKGGDATGIEADVRGDSAVADKEDIKDDAARKDAEEKERQDAETADMILKGIDALRSDIAACNNRMDAWDEENKKKADGAKKDGEGEDLDEDTEAKRLAADKAKKDADEEDEKAKAKADARADSVENLKRVMEAQQRTIDALLARTVPPRDEDVRALTAAQARADEVFVAFGERAPRFLPGETEGMYRRRLASTLKKHSKVWSGVDLDTLQSNAFDIGEAQVYADALVAARAPNDLGVGAIREVSKQTSSGHTVTEFFGGPGAHFVKGFARPARRVKSFRTPEFGRSSG